MDPELHAMITAEAGRMREHLRGALELDDLVNTGWLAALTADPKLHPAALRLRIRGAIRDGFRREWRALGRVHRQVYWPVYWPKTFHKPGIPGRQNYRRPYVVRRCRECRVEIESPRRWCAPCARERRRLKQRGYAQKRQVA